MKKVIDNNIEEIIFILFIISLLFLVTGKDNKLKEPKSNNHQVKLLVVNK